ncbi:mCG1037929 [Mus musculus]|nr:mCG1037929 [Mus musculus]
MSRFCLDCGGVHIRWRASLVVGQLPILAHGLCTFDQPVEGCDPSRPYRGLSTTVTWAVLNELLYLNSDTACGCQHWHFVVCRSQAGG